MIKKKESKKVGNYFEEDEDLGKVLKDIEKKYGKGTIMKLGDDQSRFDVPIIKTGIDSLDNALGVGGIPRGRIIEIFGPEMSGKTTITLLIIAEAQRSGGRAAFIDAEHALDPTYAKKLGVDTDNLYICQPDDGEQGLEITEKLMNSGKFSIIVIDSVAALVPKAEIDGEMGDRHIGLQARLMSQALRKLTGGISKTATSVIFINQIRTNINTMGYGPKESTTGGKALKFYASVRIDVRKLSSIKKGEEVIGNNVIVKVVKNKVAPPFKQGTFELIFGKGVSKSGQLIDLALELGIITKGGSWYSWREEKLCQGKENLRTLFDNNKELLNKLEQEVHKDGYVEDTIPEEVYIEEND